MAADTTELFSHVAAVYADAGDRPVRNEDLYRAVAERVGAGTDALQQLSLVGSRGEAHNLFKRAVRWKQQTLKHMGLLERLDARGIWRLCEPNRRGLNQAVAGTRLVAFSTALGMAVWGDCAEVFHGLSERVDLCLTSPPYALAKARAYGGPTEARYVDFILRALEPIVERMAPHGSICLNISQDTFNPRSPSRSLYCERVVLALSDKLGLHLMDRLVWLNRSKAPAPVQWASKARCQLNVCYEPIYWFAVDPSKVKADNRRVLEPHSPRQARLIAAGGERRVQSYSDGAYRLREGSFGKSTAGRIPRNVLDRGHRCLDADRYRADARALGLPVHGAMQPISIPDFLIRFLSEVGDLVVDPFGGRVTTGMAAERLGRRWVVAERVLDYLRAGGERFRECPGFTMPRAVADWPNAA